MNQYERDLLYITDKMNTNVITKWTEVDLKDQSGPNWLNWAGWSKVNQMDWIDWIEPNGAK